MSVPPTSAGAFVKGRLIRVRLDFVRRLRGEPALAKVLAELAAEERKPLAALDDEGWYPLPTLTRLDRAIADILFSGDSEIIERLGEASARQRTEKLGEHASLVNIHGFLSRIADEHTQTHNFGVAAYRRTGFNEGEIAFSGYPQPDPTYCLSARGYLRAAVARLTGGTLTVEERTCQCRGDPECLFVLRWIGTSGFRG